MKPQEEAPPASTNPLCNTNRRAEITSRIRDALLYFKDLLWGKMHARGVVSTNTQNVLQFAL